MCVLPFECVVQVPCEWSLLHEVLEREANNQWDANYDTHCKQREQQNAICDETQIYEESMIHDSNC